MSLTGDLKIVWRESGYLPCLFSTNDGDSNPKWDETAILESIPNTVGLVSRAILGLGSWKYKPIIEVFGEIKKPDERWFFINGICTDQKTTFQSNGNYLKEIFGTRITGLFNPTRGLAVDLAECITGRTFDINEAFTTSYAMLIENAILGGYKVKVIAHSQGGIIISNIIKLLALKHTNFANLEIFTFASAADGEQHQLGLFQEHFGNEEDFVSRVGLQSREYYPLLFWKRKGGKGHLLNKNYLNPFINKKICGGKSKLFSYIAK